jgi:hypothetical protein
VSKLPLRRLVAAGAIVSIAAAVGEAIRRRASGKPVRTMTPSTENAATEHLRLPSDEEPDRRIPDGAPAATIPAASQEAATAAAQPAEHEPKPAEHEPKQPSRIGYWIVILLVVATGFGLAAYRVGRQEFFSSDRPPTASGGLLIFTDQATTSKLSASVVAETFPTGFSGVSILALNLSFVNAYPGLRWYIAASGQYAPKIGMPLGAFCHDASATRSGRP